MMLNEADDYSALLRAAQGAMTLAEHAEAWWTERGFPTPKDRRSIEYITMYECWANWAFSEFPEVKS